MFYIFYHGLTALAGLVLLHDASRSHLDTPHSVGLLWTSDQPDAETSTCQHKTLTRDIHAPVVIGTRNPDKRAAADLRLRAGVHVPTKSVSVPATISVALTFHVIVMARQYTRPTRQSFQDDHRHVGVMPATPSINTPDWCAEQVRTSLPCDLMLFCSVSGEDRWWTG